jgi:RNA polymerase sigma-70 factor (ECF subfamily)
VRSCIGALEPGFREVLVLRDLEEHSYGEIGSMLNLAEGTVKSRLSRAREAVRDCLKRVVGE